VLDNGLEGGQNKLRIAVTPKAAAKVEQRLCADFAGVSGVEGVSGVAGASASTTV